MPKKQKASAARAANLEAARGMLSVKRQKSTSTLAESGVMDAYERGLNGRQAAWVQRASSAAAGYIR